MKCPKCGEQLKEGQMYCENCGFEIQIVPEFEPEIENSMHATLSGVASEIKTDALKQKAAEEETLIPEPKTSGSDKKAFGNEQKNFGGDRKASGSERKKSTVQNKSSKKRKPIIGYSLTGAVLLFLAVIGILWAFFGSQPQEIYQKAMRQMEEGRYEAAIASFENLHAKVPDNPVYINAMADCYLKMENEEEAMVLCQKILEQSPNDAQALEKLIKIYKKRESYEALNSLLQDCDNEEIKRQYLDYMANLPSFDIPGGTYREKISVKIIANAAGSVYYTLDGSDPTENSTIFTTPISVESGTLTVRAVFVNQYGVKSDIAEANYFVDVSKPDAPTVMPESGDYDKPGVIEVEVPQNCEVYYTINGKVPDETSTLYQGPFPLPAGNSTFQFVVRDEGGVFGEITGRQYNVNLKAALSMEAASNQLLLTLKNAGIVENLQGDISDKKGRNLYTYKFALTIDNAHYYLYREYYQETSGNSNVTGNEYVVNYMTGECFRAIRMEDKSYTLSKIGE